MVATLPMPVIETTTVKDVSIVLNRRPHSPLANHEHEDFTLGDIQTETAYSCRLSIAQKIRRYFASVLSFQVAIRTSILTLWIISTYSGSESGVFVFCMAEHHVAFEFSILFLWNHGI